jgi:signal transduction histidine kinase
LLERAVSAYAAQAQKQNVLLHVEADPDLPELEVDPDRIAQVLGNLINNALRYTPPGGEIVLSVEDHHGQSAVRPDALRVRVRDTGSGIAAEDLPHVFARFYRGDKARHLMAGESGLGLAIAKSLVEAHRGTIIVASELGKGTTFTIELPTTKHPMP